ncbi:myb-like DNA-binding domain-containing protein [Ophiocordyceps camponoti-floridani]|uniref:Myb-like DNA-binding domain-containing protein n=1 Tax=Ophiocordyceps camponoti-floridani TaxID=2030778 RepID=A0A8H4Q4E8_9HYPO|nr:myb-like DNA-binding domain-containing protein [Ophiocordyceps camponoti-floridani]
MASYGSQASSSGDSNAMRRDTPPTGQNCVVPGSNKDDDPARVLTKLAAAAFKVCGAGDSSSPEPESSEDESGSKCLKKLHGRVPKHACLKYGGKTTCLKTVAEQDQESSDSQLEEAAEPAEPANGKVKRKRFKKSKQARAAARKAAVADSSSSATSGSEVENNNELELSDKNDDASTEPSTPGAASVNGDSPDEKELNHLDGLSEAASSAYSESWSISEDRLLKGMKQSDETLTWRDIGNALGKTKKEVKARWKLLQRRKDKGEMRATSSETDEGSQNQADNKVTDDEADDDDEDPYQTEEGYKSSSESAPFILPGEEDDSDDEYDTHIHYGWPEQARQDSRYLHNHIRRDLYPSEIDPEPDEFFGEHDCDVLASVHSRHEQAKWLEMQANFVNATGRMIPLWVFRDKCEAAKRREEAEASTSRNNVVENWVDSVADEDLGDPQH